MTKHCCWVTYIELRSRTKVVLDWTNYATKKVLKHTTSVYRFDLTAKKDFIFLTNQALKNWLIFQLVWII